MIMGFIDTLRAEGYAVESICRVLREQGCQVAARTYRDWRTAALPRERSATPRSRTRSGMRRGLWITPAGAG